MYEVIPEQEYKNFRAFIQVYQKHSVIVAEGEMDEKGLFLLRSGSVGIYKGKGGERELISQIDAINFFGEMSAVIGGPRSATVEALGDETIVYAFRTPDLDALMSNPTWGRMLVSRLIRDLKQTTGLNMDLHNQLRTLIEENEDLKKGAIEVFSVTSSIQKTIADDAVATAREWKYLSGIVELVQKLIHARLPEVGKKLTAVPASHWKELYDEGLCPEIIYQQMTGKEQN